MAALLEQENRGDGYWKLPQLRSWPSVSCSTLKQSLKTAGCHVPSGSKKEDMVKIAQRKLLQRPEYQYCTVQELRKFCRNRKIPGASSRTTKTAMVALLRQADETPGFHCFSDLPTDLRCCVYDEYIADFPSTLVCAAQPPLARVDRMTRQELLPLFYGRVEFEVRLHMKDWDWKAKEQPAPSIQFYSLYLDMFKHLTVENMAAVRHWKLMIRGTITSSIVKLDTVSRNVTVETRRTYGDDNDEENPAHKQLSNRFKELLEQLLQRGEKFTLSDMRSIPGQLEEARRGITGLLR